MMSKGAAITIHSDISTPKADTQGPPRAEGELRVSGGLTDRGSVLRHVRTSGSLRALFPRGDGLTTVILNTAGGVTGGDRFTITARAQADSAMTVTTQAAERIYQAQPGEPAHIDVDLTVDSGATLNWLPQETLLYNRANVARTLTAHVAKDARFLAVEPLIFGRRAMGEQLSDTKISDCWRIFRDGTLVFADTLRLSGSVETQLDRTAVAGGARAMASIVMVAPRAEAQLTPLRCHLGETGGASLIREGVLFARIMARDGFELRRTLVPALEFLAGARLPRTWMI